MWLSDAVYLLIVFHCYDHIQNNDDMNSGNTLSHWTINCLHSLPVHISSDHYHSLLARITKTVRLLQSQLVAVLQIGRVERTAVAHQSNDARHWQSTPVASEPPALVTAVRALRKQKHNEPCEAFSAHQAGGYCEQRHADHHHQPKSNHDSADHSVKGRHLLHIGPKKPVDSRSKPYDEPGRPSSDRSRTAAGPCVLLNGACGSHRDHGMVRLSQHTRLYVLSSG